MARLLVAVGLVGMIVLAFCLAIDRPKVPDGGRVLDKLTRHTGPSRE